MSRPEKSIIIVGDGMADLPLPELDDRTPLMVARTPAMDRISREGRNGTLRTIPPEMPVSSAVANLSIMGYDPRETFNGRGVLEAASLGVSLSNTDMAARINLINVAEDRIQSHSAGHVSSEEARLLIEDLQGHFSDLEIKLVPGLSYRHLLVVPNGDARLECAPPHDHVGERVDDLLVQPLDSQAKPTADLLNRLILESQVVLADHPINRKRRAAGKLAANSLWPWSPGVKPSMQTFDERFGVRGAVVCAVDVIKGLGIYAGLDVIPVKGATGGYDTNYEGKAQACLEALEDHDLVYVHVEAPDEAGHARDFELKIRCIEDLDARLIALVLAGLEDRRMDAVLSILPDHPTPIEVGSHTRDPVPVAIRGPGITPDAVVRFDEASAGSGELGLLIGAEFIAAVLNAD